MCGSGYIAEKIRVGRSEKHFFLFFFFYNQWLLLYDLTMSSDQFFRYIVGKCIYRSITHLVFNYFRSWVQTLFLFTKIEKRQIKTNKKC